jgi:hypothetical protein
MVTWSVRINDDISVKLLELDWLESGRRGDGLNIGDSESLSGATLVALEQVKQNLSCSPGGLLTSSAQNQQQRSGNRTDGEALVRVSSCSSGFEGVGTRLESPCGRRELVTDGHWLE